jgi:hypothetical protein
VIANLSMPWSTWLTSDSLYTMMHCAASFFSAKKKHTSSCDPHNDHYEDECSLDEDDYEGDEDEDWNVSEAEDISSRAAKSN